jgi:hypothetical protein
LILFYYSICALILPVSDFSIIPRLPQLYSHCKATEDKDMNITDFIKDHLVNVDGIFDKHDLGDEQKPHKPFEHSVSNNFMFFISTINISVILKVETFSEWVHFTDNTYCFEFVGNIFKPPVNFPENSKYI